MEIMEEMPQDKASRSTNSKKTNYNLFSATNNSSLNTPPSTSTASSATSPSVQSSSSSSNDVSFTLPPLIDWNTIMIIILVILVILSSYGIHVLNKSGNLLNNIVAKVKPLFDSLLDFVGYSTGTAINKTADVTADVAKHGIDIAEGTVQNIGNILIGDEAIGKPSSKNKRTLKEPEADAPEDTIQKSMSSSKTKWCLVGEYQNKRGCIDISESDKCMSGQIFPNEKMCLNP
jgi:hypothetical protein